jgi:hypothetical protein
MPDRTSSWKDLSSSTSGRPVFCEEITLSSELSKARPDSLIVAEESSVVGRSCSTLRTRFLRSALTTSRAPSPRRGTGSTGRRSARARHVADAAGTDSAARTELSTMPLSCHRIAIVAPAAAQASVANVYSVAAACERNPARYSQRPMKPCAWDRPPPSRRFCSKLSSSA